jgi:signal transduction histidine kinase
MPTHEDALSFNIDARTILQLGRDSIKNPTTAVIELVKNGYDAGASQINVVIAEDEIIISDDGEGMSRQDLQQKWLRIGYSEKRINKFTPSGRRKTGEKGIGRLSTDRLGAKLILTTKNQQAKALQLKLNWDDFDVDNKSVSDIPIGVEEIKESPLAQGTDVRISDLRQHFEKKDIQQLYDELVALVSPFTTDRNFEIHYKNNLMPELNGVVQSVYSELAELSLKASYDGKSDNFSVEIVDKTQNNKHLKNEKADLSADLDTDQSNRKLTCGPVELEILFYTRDGSNPLVKEAGFSVSKLRDFLNRNAGIKIYRDDISVKPFGYNNEPSGDWLGLAQRKERDPAGLGRESYKVSSYQLMGAVSISRDSNALLRDGAAREGLIENTAFIDLRAFVIACVEYLEKYRHDHYQPKPKKDSEKKTTIEETGDFTDQLDKLGTELKSFEEKSQNEGDKNARDSLMKQIAATTESAERTEQKVLELLDNIRVLNGLATVGISSAVFGHETQSAIDMLSIKIRTALAALNSQPPDIDIANEEISKSLEYANRVASWGAFAVTRTKKDKRTRQKISITDIVNRLSEEIERPFNAIGIEILKDIDHITASGFAMNIESILLNLLTNAYFYAQKTPDDKPRKVRISLNSNTINDTAGFTLVVSDSGPGVNDSYVDNIWDPLFTTKKDNSGFEVGTGLGLSIVKSTVDELKGECSVSKDSELGGAKFVIWMPLK